jgi:hypothetical protein
VIAFLHAGHPAADIDHDAGALMAEDRREQSFGIGAGQREFIGVADAGRLDLDQHFALARTFELDGRHFQRLARGDSNGGTNIHRNSSFSISPCQTARAGPRRLALPHTIRSGNSGK